MPYTPASIVKKVLDERHNINRPADIKKITSILFDLALRDEEAAAVLFKERNRFVDQIPAVIAEEQLIQFAKARSTELVKQAIHLVRLNEEIAAKMLNANVQKNRIEQRLNALLQRIQSNKNELMHPAQPQDGRTYLAVKHNPLVHDQHGVDGVMQGSEFVPMVTRETRNFNQKLCSVGSSLKREIIVLDPKDQVLQKLYETLKGPLSSGTAPQEILQAVKRLTRSCLSGNKPDAFIDKCLRNGQQIIPLSEFILQRQGVCRHHTLLNAYFLSRLVEDGFLHGEVIHHRQDFNEGAHTWNVFRAQNGKVYSLDSLWNDVTCITDNPGAINSLYRQDVETEINRMHFQKAPEVKHPQAQAVQNPLFAMDMNRVLQRFSPEPSAAEKILQIKQAIEETKFNVGNYLLWKGGLTLQLADGTEKRVPHRVFDIYKLIKKNELQLNDPAQAQKLWEDIQTHADKAIKNPRPGRHSETTSFYSAIVSNDFARKVPEEDVAKGIHLIL